MSKPTITTVRAALQAIAGQGASHRSLYQLGAAMGPASLYLQGFTTTTGFEPLRRTDRSGRPWLVAFTAPRPQPAGTHRRLEFRGFTGADLLRLAASTRSGLVLEAGTPLECRLPLPATESLQVPAGYTESLVPERRPATTASRPRGSEAPRALAS